MFTYVGLNGIRMHTFASHLPDNFQILNSCEFDYKELMVVKYCQKVQELHKLGSNQLTSSHL